MDSNKEIKYMEEERTHTFPNCETSGQEQIKHQDPIFVITLELDEGKPKQIQIYADSKPGELAFEFCKENNLDFESLKNLKAQIENLMNQHMKEDLIGSSGERNEKDNIENVNSNNLKALKDSKQKKSVENNDNSLNKKAKDQYENKKEINNDYHDEDKQCNKEDNKITEIPLQKQTNNITKNTYTPLIHQNKFNNNLSIQVSKERNSNKNPLSKTIIKKNKGVRPHKTTKLFPYEFTITDNRPKMKTINVSRGELKQSPSSTNHKQNFLISNQSVNSIKNKSVVVNSNATSISRINTMSSQSKIKNNIFERLFKDSQIKKVAYRRPCHFSNTPGQRNNNVCVSNSNTNISINTVSLFNNIDYFFEDSYARTYKFKSGKVINQNLPFKPNISPLNVNSFSAKKNMSNSRSNKSCNNIDQQDSSYKPKICSENNRIQTGKDRYNNFNTINGCGSKQSFIRNNDSSNLYKPLRDRVIHSNPEESAYLENIRAAAFENLFLDLLFEEIDKNANLTKENLSLKIIPQNVQNDIQIIIDNIIAKNEMYSKDRFINEMKILFNNFSFEEKRNVINMYKNKERDKSVKISANFNRNYKSNSPFLFNSKTVSQIHSSRRSYSSTKKREPLKIIREQRDNDKKRNFYYVFS